MKQENGRYVNTAETGRYLSADSSEYAGGFLMTYIQEGMMPVDIVKLVKHGSDPANMAQMNQSLDFTQYGDAFRAAQRGCRQQEILRIVRSLPENRQIKTVLDIGCNTGLLGLAVIADEDGRTGVLFDMPPLVPLILESARQIGLSEHVEARGGNFLTDDLGKDTYIHEAMLYRIPEDISMMTIYHRKHQVPQELNRSIVNELRPVFSCGQLPFIFRAQLVLKPDFINRSLQILKLPRRS